MLRILAVLLFVSSVSSFAGVGDLVVSDDHQSGTRECADGTATINSNHNQLSFRACRRVVVNGNFNTIDADSPRNIDVLGNDNQVSWTRSDDAPVPEVSDFGNRNRVKPGAAASGDLSAALQLADEAVSDSLGLLAELGAVEKSDRIELNLAGDVLFDFNSATIRAEAANQLAKVAELIRQRAAGTVYVVGHTDAIGDDHSNLVLSQARAKAAVDWLQQHDKIDTSRLQAHGQGETKPVAANTLPDGSDNPEGRALNRRVEFIVPTQPGVDLQSVLGLGMARPGSTAVSGSETSCAAGRTCRADCPDGHCNMICPAGAICSYGCAGGDCVMQCSAGASCEFGCRGGNCRQICATGARCQTSCEGGNCTGA